MTDSLDSNEAISHSRDETQTTNMFANNNSGVTKAGSPLRGGVDTSTPVTDATTNTTGDKNKDKVKDENVDKTKDTTTKGNKPSALEKLKISSANASVNKGMTAARAELTDSTNAVSGKVRTAAVSKIATRDEGSYIVSGKNIGSIQKEPKWSAEQMKAIRQATSTLVEIMALNDSRTNVPDPNQEYVGVSSDGSIVTMEKAHISNLDPKQYVIGMGPQKFNTTGELRMYTDAVVCDIDQKWLINQWTSDWVVIEGVARDVLMGPTRVGSKSGRRIGHEFARVGLPKFSFGPLFNSLQSQFPRVLSLVKVSDGYYWLNASWCVTGSKGTFFVGNKDGTGLDRENHLSSAMSKLNGKSSLSTATLAIAVTCGAKTVDGKAQSTGTNYGLSVKIHQAVHTDVVDFHGPPQTSSSGMQVSAAMLKKAKPLGGSPATNTGGGILAPTNKTMFANISATAPSVKSDDSTSFM